MPISMVYVIDDDPGVRASLRSLLEAAGLPAECFSSCTEFLDRYQPDCSGCLVLDVRLPGMSGLDLQRKLRDDGLNLPAVIITGHGDVPMAVEAMKCGATDFIEKPFTADIILESVKRALRKQESQAAATLTAAQTLERLDTLTPREKQVLNGLVTGQQNKIIAHEMGISARTVEIHRARVMQKMQAKSLPELVRTAVYAGILPKAS